jgi:hypothetical protein
MNNLNAYLSKISGKHKIIVVVSMDTDDSTMNNNPMRNYLNGKRRDGIDVIFSYSNERGKIAAINRDIPTTEWDVLISTADDMEPVENDWDDIIAQDMTSHFPDLNGSLNYNNDPRLEAKGTEGFKTLITLPVIGRKLYDRFGYVYHPQYKSEWCDNEQTEVFEQLGVLVHINRRPIVHKWAENQDALMQYNMQVGTSHDREVYNQRKSINFGLEGQPKPFANDSMIIQITRIKNELFLLKEMLPIWKQYADAFVFMDDQSTDGTYEYLLENANKYNILSVLRGGRKDNKLIIESDERQQLFDEAFKYSGKIICLDTDEYLDGLVTKDQLKKVLDENKDTLFYTNWVQYTGETTIRVDGKWRVHWVDRVASYSGRATYKHRQMHSEHLPMPNKHVMVNMPNLFVSHLQWLDKKTVAIKQYFWKIEDYVNKLKFNADVIDPSEYDKSVNDFKWEEVNTQFSLKVRKDVYNDLDLASNYKYQFIKENVEKYNIPNLNDWGMGIH